MDDYNRSLNISVYQNITFEFVVPSATLVRLIIRNMLGSHYSKPARFNGLQHLYFFSKIELMNCQQNK